MFKTSESISEITKAMIAFNTEFTGLKADASNPFFKSTYISLDIILAQRGLLAKHGLVLLQSAGTSEDYTAGKVTSRLCHKSGEFIESEEMTMRPAKPDPQGMGSVISYLKRYSAAALLGIAESVDDDGNMANGRVPQGQNPHVQYQQPPYQGQYQQPQQQHTPAPQQPQQQPQQHIGLTEEQQVAIMTTVKEKGMTREQAIAVCVQKTGKDSTTLLTQKEGDVVIAALKAWVPNI